MPGIEEYKNTADKGFGIRYFYGKNKSIRLNWKTGNTSSSLMSIDLWTGISSKANYHMEFDSEISLVRILPLAVEFMKNPEMGEFTFIPDEEMKEEIESFLMEAAPADRWNNLIKYLNSNPGASTSEIGNDLGVQGYNLINAIRKDSPELFQKDGKATKFVGSTSALEKKKAMYVKDAGGVSYKVTSGGSNESIEYDEKLKAMDDQGLERVAYEDQLADLEHLTKLVIAGASNALFIAGRGGVGKTHTVEEVFSKLGLKDGDGYFKNAGSASAIGIYKLLFKYKDKIVLFDDSDGALADQDSRNIFKAATDTKKVRKLAWNKESRNMADPDEIDPDNETDTRIPKYFEFTGKILFISNLQIDKLDPDGALRTRALMIAINPTDEEVFNLMDKICIKMPLEDGLSLDEAGRREVVDVLRKSAKGDAVNLRKLVRGLNMRAALGPGEAFERMVRLYA